MPGCVKQRSSHPEVFCKKGVLRNSQNSQENTCARTPPVAAFVKQRLKTFDISHL